MRKETEIFILTSAQGKAWEHIEEMRKLFPSADALHETLMELERKGFIQNYAYHSVDGHILVNHAFTLTPAGCTRLTTLQTSWWRRAIHDFANLLHDSMRQGARSWMQGIVLAALSALGAFLLSRF